MSAQTYHNLIQLKPTSKIVYCEDYNGYSTTYQSTINTKTIAPSRDYYGKHEKTDNSLGLLSMKNQTNNVESLEYLKRQKKKGSLEPQENSPCLSKDSNPNPETRNHNNSLEALVTEGKMECGIKEANNSPTFGEDQFNIVVTEHQADALDNAKKPMSKIEQMLEQHKKRKAFQEFYKLKKECVEMNGAENNQAPQEQEGDGNIDKGDFPIPGYSVGFQSFGLVKEQLEAQAISGQGKILLGSGSVSSNEETGRFKSSPRLHEIGGDQILQKQEENKKSRPQIRPDIENNQKVKKNIDWGYRGLLPKPRISENSQKIFKKSQRAKEDALLIQELLATKSRQISTETKTSTKLANIPEENEVPSETQSPSRMSAETPYSKQKMIDDKGASVIKRSASNMSKSQKENPEENSALYAEENKSRSVWTNIKTSESLNVSDISNLSKKKPKTNTQSAAVSVDETPKGALRSSTKEFKPLNISDIPNTPPAHSPQRSVRGTTIVEHRKASQSPSNLSSYRRNSGNVKGEELTIEELKELINNKKLIYLKVVEKKDQTITSQGFSPKSKISSSSPNKFNDRREIIEFELQRMLEAQKRTDISPMIPKQKEQYDEIQRLEIILQNLEKLRREELINKLSEASPKKSNYQYMDEKYDPNVDWAKYTGEINESAQKRRSNRVKKETDKLVKLARSSSPQFEKSVKKEGASLESLCYSALLRQEKWDKQELEDYSGSKSLWQEGDLYDRSIKWLLAKNEKLNKLNSSLKQEEFKDCSFKPQFFTKNFNSSVGFQYRTDFETPASFLKSITERASLEKDQGSNALDDKNKSVYKEIKSLGSYSRLFDLKKSYCLYNSEALSPKSNDIINSKIAESNEIGRKDISD